jgi:hypothetical protein
MRAKRCIFLMFNFKSTKAKFIWSTAAAAEATVVVVVVVVLVVVVVVVAVVVVLVVVVAAEKKTTVFELQDYSRFNPNVSNKTPSSYSHKINVHIWKAPQFGRRVFNRFWHSN